MSNNGQPAGTSTQVEYTLTNTTAATGVYDRVDYLISPMLPKPMTKNKNVEKKVKRAGWSRQFFDK